MRNFDLSNPDTQYLRYKHLMSSQYYNLQANSGGNGQNNEMPHQYDTQYGNTTKSYQMPQRYKLSEI